jgi:hypothetical protein
MSRKVLWPVLVIGLALVIAPFAISLPGKASAGQDMIDSFHPIMQPAQVQKTAAYYNETFVPLRPVATGGVKAASESPQLIAALAQQLKMTPAEVQAFLGENFPAAASLIGNLPRLTPIFENVPPGLDHYRPLVTTMQDNVSNYEKIDSLPDFRLFTWFFLVPGALLILLSAWGLGAFRALTLPSHRHPVASH